MSLLHFDVFCDLLLNRHTATWSLFVSYQITKQTITDKAFFYFKIFQHNEKTAFAHFRQELQMYVIKLHQGEINYKKKINTNKKAIWRNLLFIQNEPIALVTMRGKELWLVGLWKSRCCQTWLERRSSWNENWQRTQNWTAKSKNLKENAAKVKSVFVIRAALWAKKLGRCLENCRNWKNTHEKLAVGCIQPKSNLVRVLNERRVGDGRNFCLLWLVIL